MDTGSLSFCFKLMQYLYCECPLDGVYLYGSFNSGGVLGGQRVVLLNTRDKPFAQQEIARAVFNSAKGR